MLTLPEEILHTWFRDFQTKGGNQLTLARKDIAVMVMALDRLKSQPAEKCNGVDVVKAPTVITPAKACADCNVLFGPKIAPRAMIVGKGTVCEFCARRRGLIE